MDRRYNILEVLGDGTFGQVMRAINKTTGETVAIKQMKRKFYTWDECLKLREVPPIAWIRARERLPSNTTGYRCGL